MTNEKLKLRQAIAVFNQNLRAMQRIADEAMRLRTQGNPIDSVVLESIMQQVELRCIIAKEAMETELFRMEILDSQIL